MSPVDVGHAGGRPVPPPQPPCTCGHPVSSHNFGFRAGHVVRTACSRHDPQPCGCRLYQPQEA